MSMRLPFNTKSFPMSSRCKSFARCMIGIGLNEAGFRGDSSSLPTSKTAAAVIAQAPVLTENLTQFLETGSIGKATYDGYTSCPVSQIFLRTPS